MRLGRGATAGEDGARKGGARRKYAGALLAAVLGAAIPRAAAADDGVDQCMQSYEVGQRLRREGDLVGAAAELLVCGGPACPVRMQGDCQRWLDDIERATPAVVFRVRNERGAWLTHVTASIDGAAPRRLDGRALAMNPGEHVIVFEREGYRPLRTPVIVSEGEKLERRVVTLAALSPPAEAGVEPAPIEPAAPPPSVPPTPAADGRSLWGPLALGGVAVAGGVGFAYFGVRAQGREADLEQCTPNCSRDRVDDVKDDYLRANISLGIGLAGLVGAGLWLLLDRPEAPDGGPRASGARDVRSSFGLGPTPYWMVTF
ncbi:MAG TPA: hypothetical protein VNN80_10935 [Polyangiaceae bacterium]|nr:hypothetical protein [Polyangiaceae bacterium]